MLVGFLTLLVFAIAFLAVVTIFWQSLTFLVQIYFLVNGFSFLIACLVLVFIEKPWRKIKKK